jgi:hypothetical protein
MYGRTHLIQKFNTEPCFQGVFDRARRVDPDPGPKFLIYRVQVQKNLINRVRINFVLFRKFTFEVFSLIPIELQQDCTIQNLH